MEKEKISALWWWLIDMEIATMQELKLITDINGYKLETLNDVLYHRTGYRDREQLEVDQEYIDYLSEQQESSEK